MRPKKSTAKRTKKASPWGHQPRHPALGYVSSRDLATVMLRDYYGTLSHIPQHPKSMGTH